MSLLKVENVDFKYEKGSDFVVRDINLTLHSNSMNVIIGPSGIGKSTLFSLIAGYNTPTNGEILMNGDRIEGESWERGVVFQDMALYPWLDVKGNIEFGPKLLKVDSIKIEERLEHLLTETGLNKFRDNYIYELSGGLRQRVALAREFINRPPLLMLDESFSALDNHTREEMHDILFNLWEEIHNCVVIITHDIDEAIYLGQNIIVLNNNPGTVTEKVNNPFFKKTNSDLMRDDEYLKFRDYLLGCIG